MPISAIVFGGRRAKVAPLVYESHSWQHGVFIGSSMASETTAAAAGAVGVVRRDPMAMLPFCGYNMGDYFAHWLHMGKKLTNPPKIFNINWFRQDEAGRFVWPGFGENIRVLQWILDRCEDKADAKETPIGYVPTEINTEGLNLPEDALHRLLSVDTDAWREEAAGIEQFYKQFDRLPQELREELEALKERLG
ncbi:Phosphoenolpyruvate carboxykinase [GTP] [bioreactor metagenome]|uniref:Phosphoenolpyruvate carboxykinase [GTP] n=1 Tax=bioreactor metagenome TaxID=1076179 RepID=A0A645DSI4_9ZZZZ